MSRREAPVLNPNGYGPADLIVPERRVGTADHVQVADVRDRRSCGTN
jgi:hypothetical protein